MAELWIDYREMGLAGFLSVSHTKKNLEMGDIQFVYNGKTELVVERKSIADLNSSIDDGRYSEQKSRLCSNFTRNRILYIIEGAVPANNRYIDSRKIYSGILHTMFRDGIHVYRTSSTEETAVIIMELWKRFSQKSQDWLGFLSQNKLDYALETDKKVYDKVCAKKSDNNTPQVAFINMLGQIPGCSTKIAETIHQQYDSIHLLVEAYNNNPSDKRELLLKDLQLENRKLGPVLSKRIYNYFFGITTES